MLTLYTLTAANQAELPLARLCDILGVSKSGYYDWHERAPSARVQADHTLVEQTVTTVRNRKVLPAPELVRRKFVATDIHQLWVADMTYIPTCQGFLYLAVVTDVFSRKVVGWAFGARMTADLVVCALNMALFTRKPESVIHHNDQGSQYTATAFGKRCAEMGVRPSMGTVGDAYDNAMAESFFATLECELIDRRILRTHVEARLAIFTWIEFWYNPNRCHSSLGQISPIEFEHPHALTGQPGLPTGCFAPVHKPPLAQRKLPSACPQASPVDKPPAQLTEPERIDALSAIRLMENYHELESL